MVSEEVVHEVLYVQVPILLLEINVRIAKFSITNLKIASLKNIKNFDKTGGYTIFGFFLPVYTL